MERRGANFFSARHRKTLHFKMGFFHNGTYFTKWSHFFHDLLGAAL